MAEARSRAAWTHTSSILCLLANVHRARGQRAFRPADFNPHCGARDEPVGVIDARGLKALLIDGKRVGEVIAGRGPNQ